MRTQDTHVEINDDPARLPPELRNTWDGRARRAFLRAWPPQRLLPDAEPVYVRSWLYTLGVATLAGLVLLFVSGMALAVMGPGWYLKSRLGAVVEAMHYWSVQVFFLFMAAHTLSVYLMGAFRGRALTWMLGVVSFAAAAVTGLTGFVSLQDFESQWVSTQAKDAINSTGMGGLLNLLDVGQVLTLHVIVLPLLLAALVSAHLLAVRRRGICPPYDANPAHQADPKD